MTLLIVLIIIAAVLLAIFLVLYFLGKRVQRKQGEQEDIIRSVAQAVSVLVIDKKKLKITEAGLPEEAVKDTKWYQKLQKVPVVKVKAQGRIVNVLADPRVYDALPVKCEAKVIMSGLYITEIRSIRGGSVLQPKVKKSMGDRVKGIFKKN